MARERVVEPVDALLGIGGDGAFKAGNDETNAAAVFQNSETFREQALELVGKKVLEHVGGVDGVGGVGTERESISYIKPQVDFVEQVAVDVDKRGKVFWTATEMQMAGPVRRAACQVAPEIIIRESCF